MLFLNVISDFSLVNGKLLPPSQAFCSLLSLSLFHGSEFNSVVSAPRELGRSLCVWTQAWNYKKKKERKTKEAVGKMDFSCRHMRMLLRRSCDLTISGLFFLQCWLAVCRGGKYDLLTALTTAVMCLHRAWIVTYCNVLKVIVLKCHVLFINSKKAAWENERKKKKEIMHVLWNIHERLHSVLELCNKGLCDQTSPNPIQELELHNTEEVKNLGASSVFLLKTNSVLLL